MTLGLNGSRRLAVDSCSWLLADIALVAWTRHLPGWVSEAEPARHHGPCLSPQEAPSGAAATLGARNHAACRDDERGGVFGGPIGHLGRHRGVGVDGEHDAGMAEHVLDDLEVRARSQSEGGGAVPQIMQRSSQFWYYMRSNAESVVLCPERIRSLATAALSRRSVWWLTAPGPGPGCLA